MSQSRFAYTNLNDRYGAGGGGSYDAALNWSWWRDWDASYNYPPGASGRPANKIWIVGKINNRLDGPTGLTVANVTNIDAIYAYEASIITGLINGGQVGKDWAISNEPDWSPLYSGADYAYQWGLYNALIKGLDPTARLMPGGLVCLNPNLETWLAAWGNTPDVWAINPYSGSFSADETIAHINNFRALHSTKPIVITEFSTGGYTSYGNAAIIAYIYKVCNWLNLNYRRLNVERWFWWGVLNGAAMGENGLFSASPYSYSTITPVGQAYLGMR